MSGQITGIAPEGDSSGEFGANEWLVDEMYEKYLEDKNLVAESWWPFLESYQPAVAPSPTETAPDTEDTAAEAPDAPTPEAQPSEPEKTTM